MRAKFIRGLDPKTSMGVGTLYNMGNEIQEADLNSGYTLKGQPGAIRRVFTKRSRLCLEFYYGDLKKPNGKMMHRKPYAELLMAQTGLDKFFSYPYIDYDHRTYIWYPILPEYMDKFPKNKDLLTESVRFERGKSPKESMDVGYYSLVKEIDSDDLFLLFQITDLSSGKMKSFSEFISISYYSDPDTQEELYKRGKKYYDLLHPFIRWYGQVNNSKELNNLLHKVEAEGKYSYDFTPDGDSLNVAISDIELPSADEAYHGMDFLETLDALKPN